MTTLYKHTAILFCSIAFFTSCRPQMFQVVETNSTNVKNENGKSSFENAELKITYILWAEEGKLSFNIYNKTADPIYIDWNKSHFISDGISQEYWYDSEDITSFYRTTNNSMFDINSYSNLNGGSNKTSINRKTTAGFTNKTKPKKIIQIPPMSSIIVSRFSILKSIYYTCDFPFKTTFSKDITKTTFSRDNSPLKFRNYLTYSLQENFTNEKTIDNDFHVSSVSNMNAKTFLGAGMKSESCDIAGRKIIKRFRSYPYKNASSFYIKRK